MYCNEIKDGKHRGFWLIDDKNVKQPFYHTMEAYYRDMKRYIVAYRERHSRLPSDKELRKQALKLVN